MSMAKKKKIDKKRKKKEQTYRFDPVHFFNRELSWLEFNSRVLNEGIDSKVPLLERLRFLSIYTSNLDEFVMKRVGGLKGQLESEFRNISVDGLTPKQQLEMIREKMISDNSKQEEVFFEIKTELKNHSIALLNWSDLDAKEKTYCEKYFEKNIFPILTPLSVDPGKPFPFISNLSYSFGLFLENPISKERIFSRVKIPETIHRWIKLPAESPSKYRYINTSEIILNHLDRLYHGVKIIDVMPFRVTRNADWEHDDEDTEDLLELVEESINYRRLQEPIRLECLKEHLNEQMLNYLMDELDLKEEDIYYYKKNMDYLSLDSLCELDFPRLKYSEWRPVTKPDFMYGSLFEKIKEKDILVHHPYENFKSSVEKFITDASTDPKVLSIKMTLYRTEEKSPFIAALINAAENGIQVVCLIELKARFDEKRNIYWAKKMEEAGVHVVYGVMGLKTHSKIAMVIRQEQNEGLKRYVHIGTGNYNSKTAKLYTDLGLFTTNSQITQEISHVFNYLTGTCLKMNYEHLLVSPVNAKSSFLAMIQEQIKLVKNGKKASIVAKMNSLEDAVITEALYEASQAGVEIVLIVRGFCGLRPGVKNLSENIKVISVIGRFLEHSRIYYFSEGAQKPLEGKFYIGSADWMHRNMHARVEVLTPIYAQEIKNEIADFLEIIIADEAKAWDLKSDGTYVQRNKKIESDTHKVMMKKTIDRDSEKLS